MTGLLFPGQGAQHPGMAKDYFDAHDSVKELFTLASDVSGIDCRNLLFEGSEEELRQTDKTQVAIALASLSAFTALKEKGIEVSGAAGFSLGEYPAYAAASVLSYEDMFRLVKQRGIFMEEASRKLDAAEGSPGMAAVIGLEPARIEEWCQKTEGIWAANLNSPKQTVISGTAEGLEKASIGLKELGARRIIPLKVSGPFHSPLLNEAKERFEVEIRDTVFNQPEIKLYSNVTGKAISDPAQMKKLCLDQIVSPVRWIEEEAAIADDGYEQLIDLGPGTVLQGLWKQFNDTIPCTAAADHI
jgi:[acyl-carrier-protein] S-malonyltransferase